MSNHPAARLAAVQLDEAARRCEDAAQYLAQVPPKARGWAEQMVSENRTGRSSGGPSETTPRGNQTHSPTDSTDAQRDQPRRLTGGELLASLPIQRVIPNRRQKTRGAWQDGSGVVQNLISGRHEEEFEAALSHAKRLGLIPDHGTLATAADVELKFAMKMRREGIKQAAIAVNKIPCPGRLGCNQLLKRFLPPGAELIVHGPDNFEKTYRGESDPS
ncbi:DddA-like double-stranded DNA deaminase toxin [Kribbella sp. NPDC051718]|uniref:DddA-like double-stranded DNA deaminase toxin n=1 Tax=Kribbella sp. NPDC051718 TaxID=3155168 RepID=UPI003425BE7E